MRAIRLLGGSLAVVSCLASDSTFRVNDDLFAFPQFTIEFSNSYILEADAALYLESQPGAEARVNAHAPSTQPKDVSASINPAADDATTTEESSPSGTYERMLLHGYPYLCFIPKTKPTVANASTSGRSADDGDKDLAQAVSRGSQLLQGMASNQCLYYSTGWWTYSFCYNAQITQFHALPPDRNGRAWPPQEDPTTPSYILGRFEDGDSKTDASDKDSEGALSTEVQSKAETNYLVKRLEGGTPCDLTGNDRKIEVQFHCNPQLTDRIGWIKETATCAYVMVVYTPRLCNDVAFQPPKESQAHPVTCREILTEDDVASWDARHDDDGARQALGQAQIILGDVEVGAMKLVGREGKKLDRGRIVLTQDEQAETIIMQKDGEISGMSKTELKKLDISPDQVDVFAKELQKLAGSKDWKIERLNDVNGHIQLRGVVTDDDDDEEAEEAEESSEDETGDIRVEEESKHETRDVLADENEDDEQEPGDTAVQGDTEEPGSLEEYVEDG